MGKHKLTIAVTALNAIDNPGPGVGVIRSLRACEDFELKIVGLSYETMEPGVYMHDLVDISYQVPYPSAGSDQLLNRLLYIHSIEKLDFILPNFDAELRNYIKIGPKLHQHGIHSLLPDAGMITEIDKMNLYDFCQKHGMSTPKTMSINSIDEIDKIDDEFEYPLFVKGSFYEAYKAVNKGQVQAYFNQLSAKWGLPVIIQELVIGTEIDVAGLGDGHGNQIGAIPMRKLFITDRGKGWSGVVLEDNSLLELSKKFIEATKWRGGFELEFMRTEDDRLMLLEVNPRFPAWIYLTAAAGQNLPAAAVKLGMNIPLTPYSTYTSGKMFVRYAWELITDITEFQKFSTQGVLSGKKDSPKIQKK
jgi:carbamoyl-phosphate synthase large subunit